MVSSGMILIREVVSAMESPGLTAVTFGMEATGVCGNHLVHYLREDGRLGQYQRQIHGSIPNKSGNSRNPILICLRMTLLMHFWLPTVSDSEESNRRYTWMITATNP